MTFYNFLREHSADTMLNTEENLKADLNKEYAIYFKKKDEPEGYSRDI